MLRHTLKIRWAGPAVVLALAAVAVPTRIAAAPAPAHAAAVPQPIGCVHEAEAFGQAMYDWYQAAKAYSNALPGGTPAEITDAANRLDQASDKVVQTGGAFLICLIMYL